MRNLTLGSLFDGSGGFPLAGLLAGIVPVWSSEIEPFAIRVTEKRLPQVQHFGNISGLHGAKLPPVDIITFGSPCQDMSIAGKRTGLNGSRSSLFHEAIRIIREMRCASNGKYPRYIVWKTSPEHFPLTAEKISAVSSKPSVRSKTAAFQFLDLRENGQKPERFWQNPIPSHGEFLMHNTGECPSEENGSFLSQILTEQVPEKYYLSPKACQGILRRASVRGKELPEVLRTALERQACACVTRAENA